MARKPAPKRRGRNERDDGRSKRKPCMYCRHDISEVDYKGFQTLRAFVSDKGKIRTRRVTHLCRKHQSQAAVAVKRAREVALLPYVGA
jgi:small subunit ribosomal protein S18